VRINVFKIVTVNIIIIIGNYFLLNALEVFEEEGINLKWCKD